MGWALAVEFTILNIIFELAFLPIIRVWYDNYDTPIAETIDIITEEEEIAIEDIPEEVPEVVEEEEDDINTSFIWDNFDF